MRKRKGFFIILFISFMTISYASDYTEKLLDDSIEAFSTKNYIDALAIIEAVLALEPENDIAQMYKKTIEDVISIDEAAKVEAEIVTVEVKPVLLNEESKPNKSLNETPSSSRSHEFFSLSLYIGQDTNGQTILEEHVKISLDLLVFELKMLSKPIGYDVTSMSFQDVPIDEIASLESYWLDFGLGVRYVPFKDLDINVGYTDFKIGVLNLSLDGISIVPYLGFDSEFFILSQLSDNYIFNNFWLGGSGSLYSFNGENINNYSAEVKIGFIFGYFKLGWFYHFSQMDSLESDIFNKTSYGLLSTLSF